MSSVGARQVPIFALFRQNFFENYMKLKWLGCSRAGGFGMGSKFPVLEQSKRKTNILLEEWYQVSDRS